MPASQLCIIRLEETFGKVLATAVLRSEFSESTLLSGIVYLGGDAAGGTYGVQKGPLPWF